jgi:hypothetical protein
MFFFFILLLSVYLIGRYIADNATGLIASFMVSMYPGIFGLSRKYLLDFPLVAMVSLGIYLLIRSNNFKSTRYSLVFGFVSGLGVLTKGQYILFIIGPLLYSIYRIISNDNLPRTLQMRIKGFTNLMISLFVLIAVSSIWWREWNNALSTFWNAFVQQVIICYLPRESAFFPYLSAELWQCNNFFQHSVFYLHQTIKYISPIFFIIFLIGLTYFIKSKFIKERPTILLWIFASYIIFTIISVKLEQYYFPAFPAFALVSAVGISKIMHKSIKKVISAFLITISLIQFFVLSYGPHIVAAALPAKYNNKIETLLHYPLRLWYHQPWIHPPLHSNYHQAVSRLTESRLRDTATAIIGVVVTDEKLWGFDGPYLLKYLVRLKMPPALIYLGGRPNDEFYSKYKSFNFYLIVPGQIWNEGDNNLVNFEKTINNTIFNPYLDLNLSEPKKIMKDMVDDFKQFHLVGKDILTSDYHPDLNIYLFKRNDN